MACRLVAPATGQGATQMREVERARIAGLQATFAEHGAMTSGS